MTAKKEIARPSLDYLFEWDVIYKEIPKFGNLLKYSYHKQIWTHDSLFEWSLLELTQSPPTPTCCLLNCSYQLGLKFYSIFKLRKFPQFLRKSLSLEIFLQICSKIFQSQTGMKSLGSLFSPSHDICLKKVFCSSPKVHRRPLAVFWIAPSSLDRNFIQY